MPAYFKKTWATEEALTSTGLNQMSDNISIALIGLIEKRRYALVQKTFSLSSTTTGFFLDILFSTDCLDGNPGFTAAPHVAGMSIDSGGSDSLVSSNIDLRFTNLTATGMRVIGRYIDMEDPSFTAVLHITLIGTVS